ncbi:hypothetical protein GGX14DRAFT_576498 [Mycena pura]|uniref:Uncharacterized protein n=1 Tax=Mycena pura TaxID=153505 RepID=A0AAD6XZR1_9AGAR|nr:hypothetical protein GGX14DRAFT_576498 [Mycena pura]
MHRRHSPRAPPPAAQRLPPHPAATRAVRCPSRRPTHRPLPDSACASRRLLAATPYAKPAACPPARCRCMSCPPCASHCRPLTLYLLCTCCPTVAHCPLPTACCRGPQTHLPLLLRSPPLTPASAFAFQLHGHQGIT